MKMIFTRGIVFISGLSGYPPDRAGLARHGRERRGVVRLIVREPSDDVDDSGDSSDDSTHGIEES